MSLSLITAPVTLENPTKQQKQQQKSQPTMQMFVCLKAWSFSQTSPVHQIKDIVPFYTP